MTTGGDDRLSNLTDDLLRRILYFAPSKKAASTSLLSRRWGSLWRSSGAVNLDVQVHDPRNRCFYGGPYSSSQEADDAFWSCQEAFVRGARAALDAAEAPITRLTLRVDSEYGESTVSDFLCRGRGRGTVADVVGDLLSHQAARRVEELRVAAGESRVRSYKETESTWNSGIYGLASLPSSETLCVLDLTRCDLKLSSPEALRLPRLATLRLRFCSVALKVLQALLDAAPELATVHLESLCFSLPVPGDFFLGMPGDVDGAGPDPPVLCLSFEAVTTLVLSLCGIDPRGRIRSWAMEIHAPRLQSFKYMGLLRRFVLLGRAAPGVARVDLHFLRNDNTYHCEKETTCALFWQFMHSFTNARTLKLKVGNDLKEIAAIGEAQRARLLCAFPRVERLELEGVHRPKSKTAAEAIANLLHCCPVLGEIVLKLSATALRDKDPVYMEEFLERKNRSDYNMYVDRFVRRRKSNTTMSSILGDNKYDDVPGIPGLSGRSFACLQRTLRRVGLQFRLDSNSISSCLGMRLIKFFDDHARVLEQMCVDTGNRSLDEHLLFNLETLMALAPTPISATASIQHMNLAESLSQFSRISSASHDSTIDLAKSTVGFTMLPLQRQERI